MNYRVGGVGASEEVSWLDPLVGTLEFFACLTSGRVATTPFRVARRAGLDGYRKKVKVLWISPSNSALSKGPLPTTDW